MGDKSLDVKDFTEEKQEEWLEFVKQVREGTIIRKQIRKMLFNIRKGHGEDNGLKEHIERQFPNAGMNTTTYWNNFTHLWDISPNDPLKLIHELDWYREGGGYDELGGKSPTGFTKQEFDDA